MDRDELVSHQVYCSDAVYISSVIEKRAIKDTEASISRHFLDKEIGSW